jgi:transcriptional regulator with XRE-family HTH domain
MIQPSQIRAARALLGWHQAELAQRAGIGLATIQRLERAPDGVLMAHVSTMMKLVECFESAGITFLRADQAGGIGVRKADVT